METHQRFYSNQNVTTQTYKGGFTKTQSVNVGRSSNSPYYARVQYQSDDGTLSAFSPVVRSATGNVVTIRMFFKDFHNPDLTWLQKYTGDK